MSEHINNNSQKQEQLKQIIRQLHQGKSVDQVKAQFGQILQDVGAGEIAELEQALIAEGLLESEIKRLCDVHVAVFREGLDSQPAPQSTPGHPIHTFNGENQAAASLLERFETAINALQSNPTPELIAATHKVLQAIREYDKHYLRKENILFPYLERKGFSGPSAVMWGIHDDIRALWKELDRLLNEAENGATPHIIDAIASSGAAMVTAIRDMFYKEENILHPAALERLTESEWRQVRDQEQEIGYAYVRPGSQWPTDDARPAEAASAKAPQGVATESLIPLNVGALSPKQIGALLTALPVDITFVDAEDRVRFFSQTEDRVFPRPPAIIGRKVQQCHPPTSVDRVQRILDDFRAGTRDTAEFWIQSGGLFVYIQYTAVRDENGEYLGTVEVTQELTHLRRLKGERRLLDE